MMLSNAKLIAASILSLLNILIIHPVSAQFPDQQLLSGDWQGIFQCGGVFHEVSLSIETSDQGNMSASGGFKSAVAGSTSYSSRFGLSNTLTYQGRYSSSTGAIDLSMTRSPGGGSGILFQGVVSPDGTRIAAKVGGSAFRHCSYAIVGRDFEGDIKTIRAQAVPKTLRAKPRRGGQCPANVSAWLEQPLAYDKINARDAGVWDFGSASLFLDSRFKPFFKKSFSSFSDKEIINLALDTTVNCKALGQTNTSQSRVYVGAGQILGQYLPQVANLSLYPYIQTTLNAWREEAVKQMAKVDDAILREIGNVSLARLVPLWPEGGNDIRPALTAARAQASPQQVDKLLTDLLAKDHTKLLTLAGLARLYDQIGVDPAHTKSATPANVKCTRRQPCKNAGNTPRSKRGRGQRGQKRNQVRYFLSPTDLATTQERIRTVIRDNVVIAVTNFANSQSQPFDIITKLIDFNSRSLTVKTPPQIAILRDKLTEPLVHQVNQILSGRRTMLVDGFAEKEKARFDTFVAPLNQLDDLEEIIAFEKTLIPYLALRNEGAFLRFNDHRRKTRMDILVANQSKFLSLVEEAPHLSGLNATLNRYVMQQDQRQIPRNILVAYQEKAGTYNKFIGYPGGEYLSAVYTGDTKRARKLDVKFSNRQKRFYQDLGVPFNPSSQNPIERVTLATIERSKLVNALIAAYMFTYQDRYKQCLRDDHITRKIVVTTAGFIETVGGIPVGRTEGTRKIVSYKINTEFDDAFDKVGTANLDSPAAFIGDLLFHDDGFKQLQSGLYQLMDNHGCDSKTIETFEKNMIAVFNGE